jgi:two-component system LytT family response regulator
MRNIKCAVIEDEPLGAKSLESLLNNYHPDIAVAAFAKTLDEARKIFSDKTIALFFTDVELLDGNIFEVLKELSLEKGQYIVFTTAYEEFGAKAFNYPALHYLMKPINPDELAKAINRYKELAFNEINKDGKTETQSIVAQLGKNKLVLPTQNGNSFIDINTIVRIQSSNKYSIVFTTDRKQHIVAKPLARFEEALETKGFLRTHDSHIVNVEHITAYIKGKGGELVMADNSHVPVSARRKDGLSSILKNII